MRPLVDVSCGFSPEAWAVVQRKPHAKILDATAGNRHIHGKLKVDPEYCSRIIFTDKEPNLRIALDLLCEWRDLPRHFPPDYFHCAIFDPPFIFSESNQYNRDPQAQPNGSKKVPGWYGAFKSENHASTELYHGQKALAIVTKRTCLKWNESSMSLDKVLTLFDCWGEQFRIPAKHLRKTNTWWVKLVRR